MSKQYTIEDLIEIMEKLRGENGCPWDKVQTHESIKKNMIEEAYEAIDALDSGDDKAFANELGDVLLQVVFHAQLAKERGAFDFGDCLNEICNKLISRHTHIFGDDKAQTMDESLAIWEENKKKEKSLKTSTDILKDVPNYLPALMRAEKVSKKAAAECCIKTDVGNEADSIRKKTEEFLKAYNGADKEKTEEELGDLMLALVNAARLADITPELALTKSVNKFIERFETAENTASADSRDMKQLSEEEIKNIWYNITNN